MDQLLDDPTKIQGVLYVIETSASEKKYVGQTLSHRKNHGRYRPFGAIGRLRDHISEAMNNTKKKQCTYLNNAIRLYGANTFSVRVLELCDRDELDEREQYYISTMNTHFPSGYNLTAGGRTTLYTPVQNSDPLNQPQVRGGCKFRSPETRQKMSERSKERGFTDEERLMRASNAQAMHASKRLERFKDVQVDPTRIDEYICIRKGRVTVDVTGVVATFIGKYESEEILKHKAKEFLLSLPQATLPNCSGNP